MLAIIMIGSNMDKDTFSNYKHFGQGIIEYTLILVLIALVVLVIFRAFGSSLGSIFSQIGSQLASF
jgi:Flp pilus assembly pilin Flp